MANVTYYKPLHPLIGGMYYDTQNQEQHIWTGTSWEQILTSSEYEKNKCPTPKQLIMYPALRAAWEEYLVIRKLSGL